MTDRRQLGLLATRLVVGKIRIPTEWQDHAGGEIRDEKALAPLEPGTVVDRFQVDGTVRRPGQDPALILTHPDGPPPIVGSELEVRLTLDRGDIGVERLALGLGGDWQARVHGIPKQVYGMPPHASDLTGAPIPEHVPFQTIHA